jgi:hypothetical protein
MGRLIARGFESRLRLPLEDRRAAFSSEVASQARSAMRVLAEASPGNNASVAEQ